MLSRLGGGPHLPSPVPLRQVPGVVAIRSVAARCETTNPRDQAEAKLTRIKTALEEAKPSIDAAKLSHDRLQFGRARGAGEGVRRSIEGPDRGLWH